MPWMFISARSRHAGELDDFLQDGTLSIAALYRFLALSESASRILLNEAKPEDHAWRARLGYTLARNLPNRSSDERQREAFGFVIRLFGLDRRLSGAVDGSVGVRLALSHAIYQNR